MIVRKLQQDLIELSNDWSVISVTGPRQSGKTTLCKMAFPDYEYINLERQNTQRLMKQDAESFLRQYTKGAIIDEAQLVPELFSAIQVLVDENPSLRFVLSGSSDFLLMQNISQSLAGRVAIRRLLPMSFEELPEIQTMPTDEIMYRGFYPAIWGSRKTPLTVYDSYLNTYIQRDVRQISNIPDLHLFQQFIRICASRIGTEFNAQSISNELGISGMTVKRWISILEASYILFLLQPFYRNIGKRLTKTPKIYFHDIGLVCHLLGIEKPQQLQNHPLRGEIFENMVVSEMLKQRFNRGESNNLFFYRDKSREVDILSLNGNEIKAYEVKSAKIINQDFFANMNALRTLLGDDVKSTQVIYDGTDTLPSSNNGVINFRKIV